MSESVGHAVPLSLGRRVVHDFLQVSRSVPQVVFQKEINVAELVAVRQTALPRPSWCAIFTKAYAKVVAARPDLRRAFLTFPWQRLFEYARTSVDIVIDARMGEEAVLVSAPLTSPESMTLESIDRRLADCKADPVRNIRKYRRALIAARFPALLRSWVWWYHANLSGTKRSRYFASFGVSSVGNWGVDSVRPLTPWTTTLHCGAIGIDGNVALRLTFDHRVIDGSGASSALNELAQVLESEMLAELRSLPKGLLRAG